MKNGLGNKTLREEKGLILRTCTSKERGYSPNLKKTEAMHQIQSSADCPPRAAYFREPTVPLHVYISFHPMSSSRSLMQLQSLATVDIHRTAFRLQ